MHIDLPPFRPHPLVRGGHLQTIVASYLPSCAAVHSTVHHVLLPDGDAIALHDDGDSSHVLSHNVWLDEAAKKPLLFERRRTQVELRDNREWLLILDVQLTAKDR